jgi:hypothetical protein
MTRLRASLVAFTVGAVLVVAVTALMGWLAAIPVPSSLLQPFKGHGAVAFLVHTTLLVQVPATVLSFAVGLGMFRVLGNSSMRLVLACSLPWLAYMAVMSGQYFASVELPALVKLGYLFSWQSLLGLFTVPVGVWLASLLSGRDGSNPSIERTSLSWLRQPKAAAHVERWAPANER